MFQFNKQLQLIFFDFYLTEGFVSIFKIFLILLGLFESDLIQTVDIKSFIDTFNYLVKSFRDFEGLKANMKSCYLHNQLFNKIRNAIIADKQEQLQKSPQVNFGNDPCKFELPYCFSARASRSLKNENFVIKNLDFLDNLKFNHFMANPKMAENSKMSLRSKSGNQQILKLTGIKDPIFMNDPAAKISSDLNQIGNDTSPTFPKNSSFKKRERKNTNKTKPDKSNSNKSENNLQIVRCEHVCLRNPHYLLLDLENKRRKSVFFKESNEILLGILGPKIEGFIFGATDKSIRIIKAVIPETDSRVLERANSIGTEYRLRAKSVMLNGVRFQSAVDFDLELFDDLKLVESEKKGSFHSVGFENRNNLNGKHVEQQQKIDEFKMKEFLKKYRVVRANENGFDVKKI